MSGLPIDVVLPELKETLRERISAVLVAPPGAGKTTRIPLALLDEPWLAGQKILMLEPRRLAARAAAGFMASVLGEKVGETVGYRVRMDTRVGPKTRIEVVTEGVLTRMLQGDQALEGYGIVIFDEFHERSLHADLGLALCLQSQEMLRDDLRLLVMSATLEAEPVANLLGIAPVLKSEGRAFPVETRLAAHRVEGRVEPAVVKAIMEALNREEGDILVFLPGTGEIRRTEALLAEQGIRTATASAREETTSNDPSAASWKSAPAKDIPSFSQQFGAGSDSLRQPQRIRVAPLHGSLTREDQDLALTPCPPGERKIVLATSIAETSLTVEGVRVVIDSGQMRVPRFSPRTGMTRLETVTVSRPSADQRRGRAGRLGPGVCYRMWTEAEDAQLKSRSTPEILEADLAPLALELAAWGVDDPAELLWLDPPPAASYAQARTLLQQLGALNLDGNITAHGRRMGELGLHPRLAHMILQAIPLGDGALACDLAALLNERDILRGDRLADADLRLRLEALHAVQEKTSPPHTVDLSTSRRILAEAGQWKRGLDLKQSTHTEDVGLLLAFAYPDRIAQRRPNGRYLLANGRGAVLPTLQNLSSEPYLVAAELDDQGSESRIDLAAPLDLETLKQHFAAQISDEHLVEWDSSTQSVKARKRERFGALILRESQLHDPSPEEILHALLQGVAELGVDKALPWTKNARQLQQRLHFLHRADPQNWPDVSDEALTRTLPDWLGPHLYGAKNLNAVSRLHLTQLLESLLTWEQQRELEASAPTHIAVPSGSRIPVDYSDPESPVLAVRLQEVFGLPETPRIARGRVPLLLHLLSPAQRPVQVTRDLASFWATTYFDVKKDLKGRYPKHYWPEDPWNATPTNRAKPRN
ncbi:ATP-dependent helicase HrpB [Tumebacillus flagellatus]|uniref:ATP-dependent helicase n=1 Tax=Tumebacillus flagellatus TaxID=1157490 RepID=A0A074LRT9_9BACL|nr:ATP-dependent helicase HrpB [Tumebacillus flagellatus]KEO84866.1 ATP-dependent helicase [Tumebacillus flagellatus]